MKKTKRFLALCVGLIMALGCMSVSAANAPLTVTEKPAKMIYENDFFGDTVDTDHVEINTEVANQSNGAIRTDNKAGHVATFYAAKDGITDPVTFEFNVYEYNMKDVGGAQVQMFFLNKAGTIVGDLRWYNANPKYFKVIQPSGSTAPAATINNDTQSAHIKAKLNPHTNSFAVWINGTELVSEENGSNGYAKVADFSEITGVKINVSAAGMSVVLSNLKIYTEESNILPSVWEDVYYEDFEKNVDTFTATSNEIVPALNSNVTYTHKNGALTMKTSQAGAGTNVYLQPNQEALTGKYVVEMVLKNVSQTTTNSGYHRITFGNLASYYLQWLPTKVLKFRLVGSEYADLTSQMANYKANGNTLKVTLCYDTEAYKVTGYVNDIFAFENTYDDDYKEERTSYSYINFNLYTGQIDLADLRVYRPLETDSTTGLKIEEKDGKVKIATTAAKTGNLYFAKYDSNAESGKTLDSLGVAPLNLVPGKIYTVDKANWAGAKAFFWDNDLTPIVAPWNLAG